MKLSRIIKRRRFYKNVKFESKKLKEYLYKPIFSFATHNDLKKFEYITNYVSHATVKKHLETGEIVFNIVYPVTISGTSISNIQITDAKGNIFNISLLPPKTIIYYEIEDDTTINLFIANYLPDEDEERFYTKKIYYHIV